MRAAKAFLICLLFVAARAEASPRGLQAPPTKLPDDPDLARWVVSVESVFDSTLELWATVEPRREKRDVDKTKALALWNRISVALPRDDLLRQRVAYDVARTSDPVTAARLAEESGFPDWAASLYRGLGRPVDEARMTRAGRERERQQMVFRVKTMQFSSNQAEMNDWLSQQPVMHRIAFLTRGVDAARSRQCGRGFSHFVASLPQNVRLQRVMTLYFQPCVEDNFNSVDGDLDVVEPILRTTAMAFPGKLGATYGWLVRAGKGEHGWFHGPMRVAGDWGPTGNALWLTDELLAIAPPARGQLLAVAQVQSQVGSSRVDLQACKLEYSIVSPK